MSTAVFNRNERQIKILTRKCLDTFSVSMHYCSSSILDSLYSLLALVYLNSIRLITAVRAVVDYCFCCCVSKTARRPHIECDLSCCRSCTWRWSEIREPWASSKTVFLFILTPLRAPLSHNGSNQHRRWASGEERQAKTRDTIRRLKKKKKAHEMGQLRRLQFYWTLLPVLRRWSTENIHF